MNNTINVNGMTSYYSSFIKSVTAKTSVDKGSKVNSGTVIGEKDSFISTLSSKVETAGILEETAAVSTKDMTLEEYKQYIHPILATAMLFQFLMRASRQCRQILSMRNGLWIALRVCLAMSIQVATEH